MSFSRAPVHDRLGIPLAFATLFAFIASHALRETARDALFLTDLPATRLPWAYLSIAFGALLLGILNRRLLDRFSHRHMLLWTLSLAALADLGFWKLSSGSPHVDVFALYAWTGLLGTAVTLQLWLHLASSFDVAEAKRAFPWITAGGLAGAVLGSLMAAAILHRFETRNLLLASAVLSLVSAGVAWRLAPVPQCEESPDTPAAPRTSLREIAASSYVQRIVLLSTGVAILATGVDFVFKQVVQQTVPTEHLGDFFAFYYAAVNAAALFFELFVARWLLRRLGVTRALFVLPLCLLLSATAFAGFGGFAAVLVLMGADGALRPSIFGSSVEVLYQPFSAQARNAVKTAAESLGKRGGQALGSLVILLVASAFGRPEWIAWGLVIGSASILFGLRGLRGEYIERFREGLRSLAAEARTDMPRLELDSLEVLVASLSSPEESEVLTAIAMLESYDRARLVSPLILHHPSPRVVLRALELFRAQSPPHLDAILEGLLDHADAGVRVGVLDAIVARDPHSPHPERLLHSDPAHSVRTTALVAVVSLRDPEDARTFLAEIAVGESPEERIALARALPRLGYGMARDAAAALIDGGDAEAAGELAKALDGIAGLSADWIPVLIALLSRRAARPSARSALLGLGDEALVALDVALHAEQTDPSVRRHLPRTLHLFGNAKAAEILLRAMPDADSDVRFKILRGLGRMRANDPELPLSDELLWQEARRGLERAIEMLAYRVAYQRALAPVAEEGPVEEAASSADLLAAVLQEMEERAIERVFRVLHISRPGAEFGAIFEALRGPGGDSHAGGLELIEHLVDEGLRDGILAMVSGAGEVERLRAAARNHGSPWVLQTVSSTSHDDATRPSLESILEPLLDDSDPILAQIARHRWEEIGRRSIPVPDEVAGARQ